MTNFPINIQLNVLGQNRLTEIANNVRLIQQESRLAGRSISYMVASLNAVNVAGFRSIESSLKGVNSGLKAIGESTSGTKSGLDSINKSLNSFKGNGLKTITTELKTMSKETTQLANNVNKLDFKKLNGSIGTLKSIDSTLKQLLSTVEKLKSSGNIQLNVTTNAGQVNSQLQTLNTRPHTYRTGSRNGINYYGWGADYDPMYQRAAPITQIGRGTQRVGEKLGLIGGNLMMASSFLGVKELSDTIIQTPAKAEVQKYLLSNMQGGANIQKESGGGSTTLYKTLDTTTDELPISMQNVVQPLYAFKAASGATAQELNNIIPEFANFGAQVINMTGSEEQAEEAMQKLSRAYQGQYAAVDQYGITKESLSKVGYEEGGTIEEFMDAVTKITGNAKDSMNNFNGMKALVGKDFSRAGKQLWQGGIGQVLTSIVSGFDKLDHSTGGFSTQLLVAGAGLMDFATTATVVIGSMGTTIGTFGQIWGNLKAVRKASGGLGSAIKGIFSGVNSAGLYGYGAGAVAGVGEEMIDNSAMQASVYAGAFEGTSAGMASSGVLGKNGLGGTSTGSTQNGKSTSAVFGKSKPKSNVVTKPSSKRNSFEERGAKNKKANKTLMINDKLHNTKPDSSTSTTSSRTLGKRAAKSDSFTNQFRKSNLAKSTSKLNQELPPVSKGFGKLGSILGFLTSPTGALLGLAATAIIAKGSLDWASAHSDKAKDARTNLQNAIGTFGSKLADSIGTLSYKLGFSSVPGEEGLAESIGKIANDTAEILNLISNNTPYQNDKDEAQKYDVEHGTHTYDETYRGWKSWDSDQMKHWKSRTGDSVDALYGLGMKGAGALDWATYVLTLGQSGTHTQNDVVKWKESVDSQYREGHMPDDFILSNFGGIRSEYEGMKRRDIYGEQIDGIENKLDNGVKIESADGMKLSRTGDVEDGKVTGKLSNLESYFEPSNLQNLISAFTGDTPVSTGETIQAGKQDMQAPSDKFSGLVKDNVFKTEEEKGGPIDNFVSKLSGFIGSNLFQPQPVSAAETPTQQTNVPSNQIPANSTASSTYTPPASQGEGGWRAQLERVFSGDIDITTPIQNQLGMVDFSQLKLNFDTTLGNIGQGVDLGTKASEWALSAINGFNSSFDTSQLNIGNVEGAITQHNPEARSGGSSLGKAGNGGFKSGFGDLSGIVSAECAEIERAIRDAIPAVSAAASALGAAMMVANTGPNSPQHESPGRLAIAMSEEGDEIAKAFYSKVSTVGTAASALGSNIVGSFEPYSRISGYVSSNLTSGSGSSSVNVVDDSSSSNRNVVINNNFHIDKIDSKDRVREIAETLVHIMTFNNETAGRNTDVGL